LSQIERGLRKPSADVLSQIAKALRVSAEVLYIRAGILEPSETNAVRDAITTDMAINERQKQVLLDIYTSFCAQNEAAPAEATPAGDASGDSASDVDEEPTTEQHHPQSPLALLEAPQSTPELKPEKEGNNHG
ncbi:MAG: helix-turn-helix domain-containing protein, partial [Actinomycetota bacterium]|nr:helix-turn-helix domain-containing protein [Actinomycetota bacterium]